MFAKLRAFLSASLGPGLCVDAQEESSRHRDSQECFHCTLRIVYGDKPAKVTTPLHLRYWIFLSSCSWSIYRRLVCSIRDCAISTRRSAATIEAARATIRSQHCCVAAGLRRSDRGCATGEAALTSLHDAARVAAVWDRSVAWGDSICGRRRRLDASLACSMIAI